MFAFKISALCFVFFKVCDSLDEVCDRRPLGTKTDALLPDNQFVLDIEGIRDNKYIPGSNYTVHLHARDGKSSFIAFTISLREDYNYNILNPRRPKFLNAGKLELMPDTDYAGHHQYCANTVIQKDITAKTSVKANWVAPDKGNKCVTIFAVVAVRPNIWYNNEGPLTKKVCEDPRNDDDMPPMENSDCKACEDARYELTFQGLWSYNTHMDLFPRDVGARFSDIVGASHNEAFTVYMLGSEATSGLQMLAEQANTTGLEFEIEDELGKNVRTVIKATSPLEPDMAAVTQFRASKDYHRLSIATAIQPSPDWFLGVSNMELCSTKTDQWAEKILLNLYPLDAGTDQGTQYNSSNEVTLPHQPIALAVIGKNKKVTQPFARLILKLIRTYNTPDCIQEVATEQNNEVRSSEDNGDDNGSVEEVEPPSYNHGGYTRYRTTSTTTTTTSEEPAPSVDPESSEDCPMSPWEDLECQGECIDNTVQGFKYRMRYHIVDGVAVGKYVENGPSYEDKEVSRYCLEKYSVSVTEECTEPCEQPIEEEEEDTN